MPCGAGSPLTFATKIAAWAQCLGFFLSTGSLFATIATGKLARATPKNNPKVSVLFELIRALIPLAQTKESNHEK